MNLKEYKSKLIAIVIIGLVTIGCRNEAPKGFYKFYEGDPIGDALHFEKQSHYLQNDTIFFRETPIGLLISANKRIDGSRFIKVKELSSNRRATYINK